MKRYALTDYVPLDEGDDWMCPECSGHMAQHDSGKWVRYKDVEALQAELAKVKAKQVVIPEGAQVTIESKMPESEAVLLLQRMVQELKDENYRLYKAIRESQGYA